MPSGRVWCADRACDGSGPGCRGHGGEDGEDRVHVGGDQVVPALLVILSYCA
ncbi:hypothetical protein [Streptomyces sp. NPDC002209]|uniref:hypothetical protein n=1 Tax=Streptomyces sp. NPDC002209 TaxID=3364638 RepID=UPI0036ADE94A